MNRVGWKEKQCSRKVPCLLMLGKELSRVLFPGLHANRRPCRDPNGMGAGLDFVFSINTKAMPCRDLSLGPGTRQSLPVLISFFFLPPTPLSDLRLPEKVGCEKGQLRVEAIPLLPRRRF
jgi:hypothetical protein